MSLPDLGAAGGAVNLALAMVVAAFLLALVRMAVGPTSMDRVVALELMTTLAVGVIATYAIASNQPVYVDVAVVLGLITFLGTISIARYMEKGGPR